MRSDRSSDYQESGPFFWIPFLLAGAGVCTGYYRITLEGFHLRHASRIADEASGLVYPVVVKTTEVFLTYREYWIYKSLAPAMGVLFLAACVVTTWGRFRQ